LVTALLITLIMSSCKQEIDNGFDDGFDDVPSGDFTPPKYVYSAEKIPFPELPENLTDVGNIQLTEDKVFFTASNSDNHNSSFNNHRLFSMNIDSTELYELENYATGAIFSNAFGGPVSIHTIHIDYYGDLWVVESRFFYEDIDNMSFSETKQIRKLDSTGAESLVFDITDLFASDEFLSVLSFNIDSLGNIYIASNANFYILNSLGQLLFTLDNPYYFVNFIRLSDGSVALVNEQERVTYLRSIDFERRSWGESTRLAANLPIIMSVFSGIGEYLVLYNDFSHLYGVSAETREHIPILNWNDTTLAVQDLRSLTLLSDGRIIVIKESQTDVFRSEQTLELYLLSSKPYEDLPEITILTFGVFHYDSSHKAAVEKFNSSSDTHRIHVVDYSVFNTDNDFSLGITRLTTELISGKGPDILDMFFQLPFREYVSRGMLVDLYPYLNADPLINRDSLFESVLKASEINSGLYRIPFSFSLQTIFGNPAMLGEYPGWTLEEFLAVIDANPNADVPMGSWIDRMLALSRLFISNMDEYIDFETGNAYFDRDEFVMMLEFANTFPDEIGRDVTTNQDVLIATGRQIMNVLNFGQLELFLFSRAPFGGDVVFKGYPDSNRDGTSFNTSSNLAITTTCTDIDAAWEFLRIFFTEEHQRDFTPWSFPINKVVFEEKLEKAMIPLGYSINIDKDTSYDVEPLSHEDADVIRTLINNTTKMVRDSDTIWDLVSESAEDFFNGRLTAEEAARIIQSRVMIYLSELY
ncbi:MAG: extracellular solute-binding protein, partial [Oscillospiraceae bacterium]|nr:extracellular solute-binding protein [Oscillospiraceae bacterium]